MKLMIIYIYDHVYDAYKYNAQYKIQVYGV
jgi:hypothetical protein